MSINPLLEAYFFGVGVALPGVGVGVAFGSGVTGWNGVAPGAGDGKPPV